MAMNHLAMNHLHSTSCLSLMPVTRLGSLQPYQRQSIMTLKSNLIQLGMSSTVAFSVMVVHPFHLAFLLSFVPIRSTPPCSLGPAPSYSTLILSMRPPSTCPPFPLLSLLLHPPPLCILNPLDIHLSISQGNRSLSTHHLLMAHSLVIYIHTCQDYTLTSSFNIVFVSP